MVTALALVGASVGEAAWLKLATGGGAARARTMPAGNTPTVSAVLSSVTVTWTPTAFSGGPNVSGYVIKRYDLLGAAGTVGAACAGVVSALTCTETGVPAGTWRYTVTPAQGLWRGTESAQSLPVIVA
jgi:hypothetical protein